MAISNLLLIVTGTDKYSGGSPATGLWLSELTHIYHSAQGHGCTITVASPKGGNMPVDPESLKPMALDKVSKSYWENPAFREMLQHNKSLDEVSGQMFECFYLAGAHSTMYDFSDNIVLQAIVKAHYESNKTVATICHGIYRLLNVKLSNSEYMERATSFGHDYRFYDTGRFDKELSSHLSRQRTDCDRDT